MNSLRFAHRYFSFSWKEWEEYWGNLEPTLEDIKILFLEDPFPRRQLLVDTEVTFPKAYEEFQNTLERENSRGIRTLYPRDNSFPPQILKNIPPEKLSPLYYLLGSPLPQEEMCISVVGTRSPSKWGTKNAESFSAYLSLQNLPIVSGLARGIDTIAHQENLEVGTIAVLGGGLLDVYPRENTALAEQILIKGGTLLSEFPSDQVTLPRNFPKRNETIAALSAGTIVIEGKESSGAYVTGRLALSMGKHTVVLTQDFRSEEGRAAIQLFFEGAQPVCTEEEALHYIFSRLGGYSPQNSPVKRAKRERKSAAFLH